VNRKEGKGGEKIRRGEGMERGNGEEMEGWTSSPLQQFLRTSIVIWLMQLITINKQI